MSTMPMMAVPAAATAATVTADLPPVMADGDVTRVSYVPASPGITGAATNFRRQQLLNTSKANAVVATLDYLAGVNAVYGGAKDLALQPAAYVQEGDVLRWSSTPQGTGLADPGGEILVIITRPGGGSY
jgi:hypothetical protein